MNSIIKCGHETLCMLKMISVYQVNKLISGKVKRNLGERRDVKMVTCKRMDRIEMVTQFINKHASNHTGTRLKSDLLFFWSRYPHAKFTSGVIAGALDCARKVDVEEALNALVTAEITEKHTKQGLPFYCLTTDPEKREPILRLSESNKGRSKGPAYAMR